MVETESGKQECKSIYSSFYIFILLMGFQVEDEVKMKINELGCCLTYIPLVMSE